MKSKLSVALRRASLAGGLVSAVLVPVLVPMGPVAAESAPPAGRKIVLFDDTVQNPKSAAAEHARRFGADVDFVYEHAVKGYAATFRGNGAADVARDPHVRLVEPDQAVSIDAVASWGLDRIDQKSLPLSSTYSPGHDGAGVVAYVIDTGIRTTHADFGGRATAGFDAFRSASDPAYGQDCNGHGTHVAGTIGGTAHGVAKGVSLVGVRVLDCNGSGSWSGVIAGIDWVTAQHQPLTPAVANMSLGGGASTSVDSAVRRSISDGVSFAIAAGNGNQGGIAQDACKSSPARVGEALTIGATDKADKKASWSNYGKCVDFFAPGVGITSAWHTGDAATNSISGTSMATPHVAGVAALYLQTATAATPATVSAALLASTTKTIVTSSKTTNNHLLNIGSL